MEMARFLFKSLEGSQSCAVFDLKGAYFYSVCCFFKLECLAETKKSLVTSQATLLCMAEETYGTQEISTFYIPC